MANMTLKRAALLNAASRYAQVLMSILFTMILARILTPADYGIVAVTVVFTNLFTIFADMGISAGIIQNKELTRDDTNGIFLFSLLLGIFLAICFFFFSFWIADFYSNQVYVHLGALLAGSLFCSTLNMVPNALLLKDKQFVLIAKRNVAIPFITSVLTVIMAYMGLAYYALVLQSVLSSLFVFLLNFFTARRKYGLRMPFYSDFNGVRSIFHYSLYQFLFNIVNYFARNLDNLLVGRYFGPASLGYYDKAYKLMVYPSSMLTHVITPVLQPILSDYQNDKDFIYEKYIKIVKFLSLLGVFIVAYCYVASNEIILILFGRQWTQAIPYFAWLSLSVWAQLIMGTTGSIFQSAGDTKHLFLCGCLTTCLTVGAIISGILSGELIDVARNVSLSYMAQFVFVMYLLIHITLGQAYARFLKIFIPEAIIAGGLFATGRIFNLFTIDQLLVRAIIKLIALGVVYIVLCKLLKQMQYLLLIRRK